MPRRSKLDRATLHRPELHSAVGRVGALATHHGSDSAEVMAARTEVRVIRAELAIEELVSCAPPPTAEQIRRLRQLLPADGAA